MSSENHRLVILAIMLPSDDIVLLGFSVCVVITNINDFRLQIWIPVIFQLTDYSQSAIVYLVDVLLDAGGTGIFCHPDAALPGNTYTVKAGYASLP